MFTKKWQNSTRDYGVVAESDVYISLLDGTNIDCDLFRPDAEGIFPAILGVHANNKSWQTAPSLGRARANAGESGCFFSHG